MDKTRNKRPKRVRVYGMSDIPGGMESYIMYMIRHAEKEKVEFDFITVFPDIAYRGELENKHKIYKIPAFAKHPISHIKKVVDIMLRGGNGTGYDYLYINTLDAGSFGTALAGKLAHKKVIVHSHNSDTDRPLIHKFSKPMINMFADKRYACSEEAGKHMFGNREFKIVENKIDESRFAFDPVKREKLRKELCIEDKFVICHIGRIVKQKNPYGVINIFKGVKEKRKDAVLLYVGDGDMRDEIDEYINYINGETPKIDFKNSVKMLGVRDDIPDILSASDVFILPSLYEGFGIVAIEAQKNGLPTIVSHSVPETVRRGSQIYFMPEDENQWIELILRQNIR